MAACWTNEQVNHEQTIEIRSIGKGHKMREGKKCGEQKILTIASFSITPSTTAKSHPSVSIWFRINEYMQSCEYGKIYSR